MGVKKTFKLNHSNSLFQGILKNLKEQLALEQLN